LDGDPGAADYRLSVADIRTDGDPFRHHP
jgi:hypothetical protein